MTSTGSIRVLVADDEPPARQRLLDLLNKVDNVEVAGAVATGREAVDAIRAEHPDIVFLDIQMPGLTGLDVVREIGPDKMPVTVFVTAFDQHTLDAFEVAAIDYLLKPFDDDRFMQALDRARAHVRLREVDSLQDRLASILRERDTKDRNSTRPAPSSYLERIAVEMRGQVRVVPVERIDYIQADGAYAELHAGEETFVIRERMQTLEDRLDPAVFFRIHRSTIVRIDRIDSLLIGSGGDYAVRLHDGTRLRVGRSRYEELASRLGLDAL